MKSTITWKDFEKIDLRLGTIVKIDEFPKAHKPAYKLEIDFGPQIGVLKSSAQVTVHYDQKLLLGKQVLAVVNFPRKQIADFMSECLVTGFEDENGDIVLATVEIPLPNGANLQ